MQPIDRDPDQEIVFGKKLDPLTVDPNRIGLKAVGNAFSIRILFLIRHHIVIKIQSCERRFPSLP
ncbi:hypothetical protein D3C84_1295950 [compost metagenome]